MGPKYLSPVAETNWLPKQPAVLWPRGSTKLPIGILANSYGVQQKCTPSAFTENHLDQCIPVVYTKYTTTIASRILQVNWQPDLWPLTATVFARYPITVRAGGAPDLKRC